MLTCFKFASIKEGCNLRPGTILGYYQTVTRGLKYLATILKDVDMEERLDYGGSLSSTTKESI